MTTQRRAKFNGEIGVNGEEYKRGQFIANTDRPKAEKKKLAKLASNRQVVEPGKFEVPAPGKMSILARIGGLSFNHRDGKTNYAYLEYRKCTMDEVRQHEELAAKYIAGERWVNIIDYPAVVNVADNANLITNNLPVPEWMSSRFGI